MSGRCWLARVLDLDGCRYRADGKPDRMHVGFSKTWLTKAPTGPHLTSQQAMDARLLYDGCRRHHVAYDGKRLTLPRSLIPKSVESFAEDHKLTYKLDHDYGPKEAE